MKQVIVFIFLMIGYNISVIAQTDTKTEVFINQLQQKNEGINEIYEGEIEFSDHPLVGSFLNLHQMLAGNNKGIGSTAYSLQEGNRNLTEIAQIGFNHLALSWQMGNNNLHNVHQNGPETTASAIQYGDGNEVRQSLDGQISGMVIQIGNGNLAEQELFGTNNGAFSIQQEGNNNFLYQRESGSSVPYRIRQRGDNMELIIIDSSIQ